MSVPVPMPTHLSDADLAARVRHGDEQAFRALFERYYAALCRYAHRLTGDSDASEDVVQALFTHLWQQRESWEVRGTGQTSVRAYLYMAVHRRVTNEWRAAERRRKHAGRELGGAGLVARAPLDARPDTAAECADLVAAGCRAIAALPPRQRQAFELFREHGLSYKEIAEVMGVSTRTVELHLGLAVVAFRRAIAAYLSVALVLSIS